LTKSHVKVTQLYHKMRKIFEMKSYHDYMILFPYILN